MWPHVGEDEIDALFKIQYPQRRGTTVVYSDRSVSIPVDEKRPAQRRRDEAQSIPFLSRLHGNLTQCGGLPDDLAVSLPPEPDRTSILICILISILIFILISNTIYS